LRVEIQRGKPSVPGAVPRPSLEKGGANAEVQGTGLDEQADKAAEVANQITTEEH
jgi:hypothetical protein